MAGVDVEKHDALVGMFARVNPDVVVNCIGLTKHHKVAVGPQMALPLNALLPHRMTDLCGGGCATPQRTSSGKT